MENVTPTVTPPVTPAPTEPRRGRMLRRLFLISVILLGVLTLGAVAYKYLIDSDSDTVQTQPLVTNEAQVSITKDGFVPATITVSKGTQLTWTNTDTEPHQVAADPYPKNDSIPGFDSTIILQQDESFSFTFEQSGTYTYHDELHPLDIKGTIVVE